VAFEPIVWAFKNERLGGNELLVLTCLALYASADGRNIYPSVATIAKETGLGRRTVQRVLRALEEARWIVQARPNKVTETYRNIGRCFALNYKRLKPQGRHHDAGATMTRGATMSRGGRHHDALSIHYPSKESVTTPGEQAELLPKPDPLEGFDDWWKQYPNKVAKKAAQRAWKADKPDAALRETIMADTITRDWPDERRYILHPATYLNGARWEDEKPPSAEGVSRGTTTQAHKRKSAVDKVRDAGQEWLEEQQREREAGGSAAGSSDRKIIEGVFTRRPDGKPK
jgi:hypothetical protein